MLQVPRAHVLLVGSQAEPLQLLSERLTKDGYVVRSCASAQDALDMCQKNHFHLVLTQLKTAGMSGLELKKQIRARHPLVPVVVLENFRTIRSSDDLLRFGPSDFILDADELAEIVGRLSGGKSRLEERLYANPEVQNFLVNLILAFTEMLGRMVPAFGPNQADKRVLAMEVARRMGLPERTAQDLGLAALLYDLGKVKLSEILLTKMDELTVQDQLDLHNHCHWSIQVIERLGLPERLQQIVLHHHENYDGTGYPQGLSGRAIPIGSRIISVVDSFFAMISPRPYREPRTEREALVELNLHAGTQFDPEVVEHFVRVVDERYHRHGEGFRKDIAIIDDDAGARELMRLNFEREGYTVRLFATPAEALERLPTHPPSLIIADVVMPDMSGFQLLERLRAHAPLRHLPFVFVSGARVDEFDKVKGLDLGADDYLEKPIKVHELNSKVRALLRRAQHDETQLRPTQGIVGNLRHFPLPDIIQILYQGRKTAVLDISSGGERVEIFVEGGSVVHVELFGAGACAGMKAFVSVLKWQDADFSIRHGVSTEQRTIHIDTSQLVLQALVELDTQSAARAAAAASAQAASAEATAEPTEAGPVEDQKA